MQQLKLWQAPIETIVISPTKEMPLDFFLVCHRLAYYMELMERIDDNHVIWDETVESLYSEGMAEAEYMAIQNGWIETVMEIPKPFYDSALSA